MNRALRIRRNKPEALKLPDIYKHGYNDGIAFAEKQFKKKHKEQSSASHAENEERLQRRLIHEWQNGVDYGRANPAASRLNSIEGGLMIFGLIAGIMFGAGSLINLFVTDYISNSKLILLALMSVGCFQAKSVIEVKRILR
jgi:hypothetical protein